MYSHKITVTVAVIKKKEHSEKDLLICIIKLHNFSLEYFIEFNCKKNNYIFYFKKYGSIISPILY